MERPFNPGDLCNQVVIQALPAPPARNTDGSQRRSGGEWATFAEAWAKVDTRGGKEFFAARAVNAELTHELTIYWQAGIQSKMRVLFADPVEDAARYFDIQAIVNPTPSREVPLRLPRQPQTHPLPPRRRSPR